MEIIISGCTGHMGQVVKKLIEEKANHTIVCGFGLSTPNLIWEYEKYPIFCTPSQCNLDCDVVIDFSNPSLTPEVLEYCRRKKAGLVLATTGLSGDDFTEIYAASKEIPIFQSYNMSVGIALLKDLACKAAKFIGDEFDIEIVEKHHRKKIDAPSGTAYLIADAINKALEEPKELTFDRHERKEPRPDNEIGIHSVRGGTIVGEHSVILAGNNEVIEFTHKAESKELFAVGALKAAKYIYKRNPGLYNMDDLVREYSK